MSKTLRHLAAVASVVCAVMGTSLGAVAQGGDKVLTNEDTTKLLADKVYYKGQSAPTQPRNSGGVKFADGYYMLATLVDTSGYSSDVQSKYQAYFITEVPLKIGGHTLPAGIYGVGFIGGDKFAVTDVGAHDVFSTGSSNDAEIKRPRPMQVTADPKGGFRLYSGRKYVNFSR